MKLMKKKLIKKLIIKKNKLDKKNGIIRIKLMKKN